MIETALIGFVGGLIAVFVKARFDSKEQRRKEILALAEFIASISELLLGMQKKLSNAEVPTYEGNNLKQILKGYKETISNSKISKIKRKELENLLPDLEKLLTTAEFEDEVLRGSIISYDAASKDSLLKELQRSAARLKGMSDTLKVL